MPREVRADLFASDAADYKSNLSFGVYVWGIRRGFEVNRPDRHHVKRQLSSICKKKKQQPSRMHFKKHRDAIDRETDRKRHKGRPKSFEGSGNK